MLNYVQRYKDTLWSGGLAPRILIFGSSGRLQATAALPQGKNLRHPLTRKLSGYLSLSGRSGEEKKSLPWLWRELNLGRPSRSLVAMRLSNKMNRCNLVGWSNGHLPYISSEMDVCLRYVLHSSFIFKYL